MADIVELTGGAAIETDRLFVEANMKRDEFEAAKRAVTALHERAKANGFAQGDWTFVDFARGYARKLEVAPLDADDIASGPPISLRPVRVVLRAARRVRVMRRPRAVRTARAHAPPAAAEASPSSSGGSSSDDEPEGDEVEAWAEAQHHLDRVIYHSAAGRWAIARWRLARARRAGIPDSFEAWEDAGLIRDEGDEEGAP